MTADLPSYELVIRVYYEDTDAAGVVYYANYLKYIERARSEWLRSMGVELGELAQNEGVVFPVRSLQASYEKPARLGDEIAATARLVALRRASIELAQTVVRDDDQLFSCRVQVACVDSVTFRPKPIPASMLDQVQQWKTQ